MKLVLFFIVAITAFSVFSQPYKTNGCYISLINPYSSDMSWENDSIKFTFTPYTYWWNIEIENKTNNKITCLWDETLFIVKNRSSHIAFDNTLKLDIDKPKGESIIASRTDLRKSILPVEKAKYGTISDVFYRSDVKKADVPIRIIFPIKFEETIKNYEFVFNVTSKK
jgi:hypothetical protein